MLLRDNIYRLNESVSGFIDAHRELDRLVHERDAAAARCLDLQPSQWNVEAESMPSERKAAEAILEEASHRVDSQYAFVCSVYEILNDSASALLEPPKKP